MTKQSTQTRGSQPSTYSMQTLTLLKLECWVNIYGEPLQETHPVEQRRIGALLLMFLFALAVSTEPMKLAHLRLCSGEATDAKA